MAEKSVRVPPQDVDMERALLGALMMNSGAMYEIADIVAIDSFYAGCTEKFMMQCSHFMEKVNLLMLSLFQVN